MSISVEVSLLSGKTATVHAGLNETVETLTQRAQIALAVGERAVAGLVRSRSGRMRKDRELQVSKR